MLLGVGERGVLLGVGRQDPAWSPSRWAAAKSPRSDRRDVEVPDLVARVSRTIRTTRFSALPYWFGPNTMPIGQPLSSAVRYASAARLSCPPRWRRRPPPPTAPRSRGRAGGSRPGLVPSPARPASRVLAAPVVAQPLGGGLEAAAVEREGGGEPGRQLRRVHVPSLVVAALEGPAHEPQVVGPGPDRRRCRPAARWWSRRTGVRRCRPRRPASRPWRGRRRDGPGFWWAAAMPQ